jgi:hemerythrin-like metal-binding protein
MTEFFPWRQDLYSVGVITIDEQHKKLFSLINALFDAMKIGKGSSLVGKTLDELIEYTKNHFRTEEDYMIKCNYPAFGEHKKIHDKLTEDVKNIKNKFLANPNTNLSIETLDFLRDWLTQHIQGTDKKYVPYMKNMK